MLKDVQACAAALYDGGWRAEDKEELMVEYGLSAEEADAICQWLEEFTKKENNHVDNFHSFAADNDHF